MTFSINLPTVLSKTIGLNDLGESYNLSRPGVDKLLQLVIAFLNSSLEKEAHGEVKKKVISSRTLALTL